MKKIWSFALITFFFASTNYAQKEKLEYVDFNAKDQVVAVCKSGRVVLLSGEDLSVISEKAPGDKKNNAAGAVMSPSREYLIVSDRKIKSLIVYSAATLQEVKRISNSGGLPYFLSDDKILLDKKIVGFPDEKLLQDLNEKTKYDGFIFSSSSEKYLNYETGSTIGDTKFEVMETSTGKSMAQSQIGEKGTSINWVISDQTKFIGEDSIKFIFSEFASDKMYQATIAISSLGEGTESIASIREDFEENQSMGVTIDYQNRLINSGKYVIDPKEDYSLYGMGAFRKSNSDNSFVVIGTPKTQINLYRNDPEGTKMIGDQIESTLVASKIIFEK